MKKQSEKNDPLRVKTLNFAVRIVNLAKYLREEKMEFILGKQIIRSGTNPGAMVRESSQAESGADFIHKLSIALKEISETQYWLELLNATKYITEKEFSSLQMDATEIAKLLTSSNEYRTKLIFDDLIERVHPPAPLKGGLSQRRCPPLRGAGG